MELKVFLLAESEFGYKLLCSSFLAQHIKSILKRLKKFLTNEMKMISLNALNLVLPQILNTAFVYPGLNALS